MVPWWSLAGVKLQTSLGRLRIGSALKFVLTRDRPYLQLRLGGISSIFGGHFLLDIFGAAALNKDDACYKPGYTSDPCYTKWQLVAIFRSSSRAIHKLQMQH
eukprot:6062886-Pleurochrysis_carterae.AAC.1